jgi:hypothetical protein
MEISNSNNSNSWSHSSLKVTFQLQTRYILDIHQLYSSENFPDPPFCKLSPKSFPIKIKTKNQLNERKKGKNHGLKRAWKFEEMVM